MKLLFGTNLCEWGGGEKWMLTAARQMAARGHSVWLCAPERAEIRKRAAGAEIPTVAVEFDRDFDPVSFGRVFKLCRREHIDVFCLNMDRVLRVGGTAARLAGVPAVIPRRGSEFPLKAHLNYRFQYQYTATAMIVNSAATEAALCRGLSWRPRGTVHVLHNGLDLEPYESLRPSIEVREELGMQDEDLLITQVGELTSRKNPRLLVHALSKLVEDHPRARVLFVGEGPERDSLRQLASALGVLDRVHLLGFRRDVPDLVGASDVLAHPSHLEGFGFAVVEAMAASRPVVATNISSLPEIVVDGETGMLFEDDNVDGFVRGITAYLSDRDLARRHGAAGRARVESEFELNRQSERLEEIFARESGR